MLYVGGIRLCVYMYGGTREVSISGGRICNVLCHVSVMCVRVYNIYVYIYFIDNALRGKRETARKR